MANTDGRFRNVTLEMSLKPFRRPDEPYCRDVVRKLFGQWSRLLVHADRVSVLLWTADGSEILEYTGDLDSPLEWARYIGGANRIPGMASDDPDGVGLHSRPYLYIEDPPEFDLRWLAQLTRIIREEGRRATGLPVRVGETFDPGPEFAVSAFKYTKHPEICMSTNLWKGFFVTCYSALHADPERYAGFPDGVPEGTPFGTFFGRQAELFLSDCGFDYLWLSNGFGFGMDTWNANGALFDGASFDASRAADVYEQTLGFWRMFRAECSFPVETRGTNMSTGMDLASDGVPLLDIYRGGFDLEPPPNSPWAALDGDFGLELTAWMSHIPVIPGETYPFRFYTHDPWWMNSPWLDRYERQPHDIYLPLAVSRVRADGTVHRPDAIDFLSVDDSLGRLPDTVPNEVIPHILSCRETAPDQIGPFLWVYPFSEYHAMIREAREGDLETVFFGDWFIRSAINTGFPLNTVISSDDFRSLLGSTPAALDRTIAVIPVIADADELYREAIAWVAAGGRAVFYGSTLGAPAELRSVFDLTLADPLEGEFDLETTCGLDRYDSTELPRTVRHVATISGGALCESRASKAPADVEVLAELRRGTDSRVFAVFNPRIGSGAALWVRGSNSFEYPIASRLPTRLDQSVFFDTSRLLRFAVGAFGYEILEHKDRIEPVEPIVTMHRHKNAFYVSGFVPNTTTRLSFRFPWGAPVFTSTDTRLESGRATYHFPRAFRHEARVFLDEQSAGVVSCAEVPPIMVGVSRRILVRNLKGATVRFLPVPGHEHTTSFYLGSWESQYQTSFPADKQRFRTPAVERFSGEDFRVLHGVTGDLLISW
ncbi:MAG: hypothetical protein EA426_15180 [Spirochaetaceae bacterium]|nr:MAG: hypothetical protein EA426_15180 [Spirochaetaceae bacterium]